MATQKEKRAQFRERQIIDFAILEALEKPKAQDTEPSTFSREVIANILNVGQSTLNRWEYETAFIDTMKKAGGANFSRIRIVFELYALATAQGREISVDLQKEKKDRKIAWNKRFLGWRKKGKKETPFEKRVTFYKSLPDSELKKEEGFWTDRFNNISAAVEIDVKTEVLKIQIRYAIDEILDLLQTPEALDTFFRAVEHRQVPNEEDVRKTVIKGARRAQMRTVELIKALEDRVPSQTGA